MKTCLLNKKTSKEQSMTMKRTISIIITIAVLAASCSMYDTDQYDDLVAMEMAEQLANQETGLSTEMHDSLNLVMTGGTTRGEDSGYIEPANRQRTIIITTENGELNGFTWDETDGVYRRSGYNLGVESANHLGTIISFEVEIKLFTNNDLSGDGYQLEPGKVIATDSNVKSMLYRRVVDSNIKNKWRDITRDAYAVTDISITGIHDETEGVLVSGGRTTDVTVESGLRTGSWTLETTFNDVDATRTIEGDTRYYTYQGSADLVYDGTFTTPLRSTTIHSETTVLFNRFRTVTITVNGSTIILDITTGDVE
jgi:hypothetical protein